jgi:RIO-like serine/threonine protein kinase
MGSDLRDLAVRQAVVDCVRVIAASHTVHADLSELTACIAEEG